MKYGFIYMTTNLVNRKKYIDQRRYHSDSPESDAKYLGSGINMTRAIKKYGIENFTREILEECDTLEDLNNAEIKWISKFDAVNDKNFYNIAAGGLAGDTWNGQSQYKKRKFKKRIAESNRTRQRDVSRISGSLNPAFGRHWYKDVKNRKQYYLHEDDPRILQLGLIRGMFRSKRHNEKISSSLKGKPKAYKIHSGMIMVTDGTISKYIDPSKLEEYQRHGFVKGGAPRKTRGKVHMNNGLKNIFVHKNKIQHYISLGFELGWHKK